MQKWKHKLLHFHPDQAIIETLDEYGAQGWEIVSTFFLEGRSLPIRILLKKPLLETTSFE